MRQWLRKSCIRPPVITGDRMTGIPEWSGCFGSRSISRGSYVPRLESCKKFKQVNVLTATGVEENHLPASIKYIPPRTFSGTAIKTLYLPEVVEVWEGSVGVFEGCNNLELVQFGKAAFIGRNAFANIHGGICTVDYHGPSENWNYKIYHHSPNVAIVMRGHGHFYEDIFESINSSRQFTRPAAVFMDW